MCRPYTSPASDGTPVQPDAEAVALARVARRGRTALAAVPDWSGMALSRATGQGEPGQNPLETSGSYPPWPPGRDGLFPGRLAVRPGAGVPGTQVPDPEGSLCAWLSPC